MDLTQREEQVVTADDSVSSLGLVFVSLPPLPPPPMVVKHVHSGTWADNAGIGPGCEVLELGGLKVGNMTREEFQKAIKSRPLRIRLQPPNSTAWKQVAHFQREVVRLQLKKVLLQKSLRDEHEKVKAELGLDAQAEEDRRSKNKESRAEIARERQRAEDQKQQLVAQEAEIQQQKQQCETFDRQTQQRRRQLEAEKLQLEKQQADLEKARGDFQDMRKSTFEAIEKEKQELAAERRRLDSERAELSLSDNQELHLAGESQRQELAEQQAEFEAAIQEMRVKMEKEQEAILSERAELEDAAELISTQRAELQAQKFKLAQLEAEIDERRAQAQANEEESQRHLESERQEMNQLRAEMEKDRADFSEKSKKVQQQITTQKRQLAQIKNKLVAEKNAIEAEKAKLNVTVQTCEEATQTEVFSAASAVSTQTETPTAALPAPEEEGEGSENTDDPGSLVEPSTGGASELMDLMAKIQAVLQDPKFDAKPTELHLLCDTLQRMVETLGPPHSNTPGAVAAARRMQKSSKERTTHRACSAFAVARPPRRAPEDLAAREALETPQSEKLAKKALAQTVVVRKLLASELNRQEPKKSPEVARSPSRELQKTRSRNPAWGLRSRP